MKINFRALTAIYLHEMDRFRRTLTQSLLSPVLTTSLYFIVFGSVIGGYVEKIDGISYGSYIVPGLLMLTLILGRHHGLSSAAENTINNSLRALPDSLDSVMLLEDQIIEMAEDFDQKEHALFLGRGIHYPVAMEGALKLKEMSYIHAEAYPAGELKHGPLALVDSEMPVVAVAPNDDLLAKLQSNLEEVRARGGKLYVFGHSAAHQEDESITKFIELPEVPELIAPLIYSIPLQLLAYHVAILKGTDIDQPRNLAKSVTVE